HYVAKSIVLVILLAITLLPLCILSFYNHPCWDDYFDTDLVQQKGFLGAQSWWYFNWSGRYFASALLSVNPLVYGAGWGYKLNTIAFLLLLLISTYWLSGELFQGFSRAYKIGISAVFIFTLIAIMPNIGFGLFWQCSIYTIFAPCILTLFLLGSIIGYYRSGGKKIFTVASCLLSIAIVGSYEISMVFVDALGLVFVLVARQKKWSMRFPLLLFAICIVFSLIEIMAPGNAARGTMLFPNAHKLVFSITKSFKWGVYLLSRWLPFMAFVFLFLFDLFSEKKFDDKQTSSILIVPPWLSLIACMAIPVVNVFIYFWATGTPPSQWYINGVFFYFVLVIMYFFLSVIVYVKKRYPDFNIADYIKIPLYLIFLGLMVFHTNNITTSYKDVISGNASAYNAERTERDNYIRNNKNDSCMVDSIRNIPHSIFFSEIPQGTNNSNGLGICVQWMNNSYYGYYHKKYIGVKKNK
ncbi:MAG TPA: hypothetical protein VN922_15795, partial [Bacteroidia bacterium]|nr:hypothetical protein [Bacteroidia bacterium]